MTIRVAVADDQALVRDGLHALLTRMGFEVAVEAQDGATLLTRLQGTTVDVIVCDVRMPGLDGIGMVRELRRSGDKTPVVMLTTFEDGELLPAAVEAGAQAFLLKGASSDELLAAIERAYRGEQWLAPVAMDSLRGRLLPQDNKFPSGAFGDRELAILRLLAGGYSNKEIARTVHLAEGTVKNYVSDILAKLGTRDRTRAVLKAITQRII